MVADGYKETEIGVIPDGWDVVKLEDITTKITSGGTPSRSKGEYFENGTVNWLKTGELKDCYIYEAKERITEEAIKNSSAKLFPIDTLLIAMYGATIGQTAYLKTECATNQACCAIIFDVEVAHPFFYWKYFYSIKDNLIGLGRGAGQPNISQGIIKALQIPLPPLKEQAKIADILSTADDKIDAIASQIEKAKTLKKGLLQKLLSEGIGHSELKDSELGKIPESWEVVELNDLCSKIVGGGTPNSKIEDYWKNGTIYWATVKDMDNSKYLSKTQDTITDLGLKNSSANLIPANSIITATRMGLGRFFINTVDMAINQDLKALILKKRYDKNFIFWSLVSKSDFILSLGTGTTVKGIRLEEFKTIKFTIPPLEEQKQIADILSTTDEKLEVLRAKKEKYETLKIGLLQKLLSGEVRV